MPTTDEMLCAVIAGDAAKVRSLIERDPAIVHCRDAALGSVPLIFAAHRGFAGIVEILLAAGAEAGARERASGATALHWAAESGQAEVVRVLMAAGAELEARDEWFGLTPVGWGTVVDWAPAFRQDRLRAVEALRGAGANVDVFAAVVLEETELLRTMSSHALQARLGFAMEGRGSMAFAATRGSARIVRVLAEAGVEVDERSAWGMSALADALRHGCDDVAAELVRLGAVTDQTASAMRGDWAAVQGANLDELVMVCAMRGDARGIRALAAAGRDMETRVRVLLSEVPHEVTALHLAAHGGHAEACAALLDLGLDVNSKAAPSMMTPLHCAVQVESLDVARLLKDRGADLTAVDQLYYGTPGEWAEFGENEELARLLR